MTIPTNEIQSELAEHTMLSLIMAIFIFYVTTSLGLYFAKTLSPESFYSLSLSFILVLWTFKEHVIDFISPALLRLFGVGGQGYLHLLSLWFVDPRDLTVGGVASRVLAGSYSAILAGIFFIPLLLTVITYLTNLYDALTPQVAQQDERDSVAVQSPGNRPNTSRVSLSAEAPLVYEPFEEDFEKWILTEFNMDAFLVLCPLGRGVTSYVVLAKIDPSRTAPSSLSQNTYQSGSLFNVEDQDDSNVDEPIVKQEGSFWAASSNSTLTTTTKTEPDAVLHNRPDLNTKEDARDMFDDLLTEIEDDKTVASEPSITFKAFGPGGGPTAAPSRMAQIKSEGTWRKLEPAIPPLLNIPRTSSTVQIAPLPMSRQVSRASSKAGSIGADSSAQPSTIIGKIRMNSQSMTRLSEMAGEVQGDGDAWWRPLQWLDEVQRKKSGMDEVFAAAPGLVENVVSLSDLAQLERSATIASSRSSLNHVNGDNRRGSLGEMRGNDIASDGRKSSFGGRQDSDGEGRSPKPMVKFSTFPSVLSLTESELLNLDAEGQEDQESVAANVRQVTSLDEMPDLVAIKIMRKSDIERMQLRKTVENERRALAMCASPFVCNMFGAFQDPNWGYILLEPVPAGDLAGLLEQRQVMFEDEARFYVGCLLLALEHLHARGIVCLDVKPENLLLDQYGYCKLCDLGIARILSIPGKPNIASSQQQPNQQQQQQQQHWEFVGTPEYMSPEVICRHKIASGLPGIAGPDLWACGILLFELLSGETPFAAETNGEVVTKIQRFVHQEKSASDASLSRYQRWTSRVTPSIDPEEENPDEDQSPMSPELERTMEPVRQASASAKQLIRSLLRTDPQKRLGCRSVGAAKVMEHSWFTSASFDWRSLRRREMKAPFVPNPLTLAPPFRGEQVEVDIVREKPLSVLQVQACQDFLKGHSKRDLKSSTDEVTWKGFIPITPELKKSLMNVDRKDSRFLTNVRHVQKLFRDDAA